MRPRALSRMSDMLLDQSLRPRNGGDRTGGFDDPRRNDPSSHQELTPNGRRQQDSRKDRRARSRNSSASQKQVRKYKVTWPDQATKRPRLSRYQARENHSPKDRTRSHIIASRSEAYTANI